MQAVVTCGAGFCTVANPKHQNTSWDTCALSPAALNGENIVNIHEWLADKWGVLFSRPADYTPVCTTELGTVAKYKEPFDKRNVKVAALSVDPLESHKGWIKDIIETPNTIVSFTIIADEDRKVSDLYDMIHPNAAGKTTVRLVFVIGNDKKVKLTITYPASTRWS